jgi:hypothetical protein
MATGYRSTTNYRASIPYQGVVSSGGTASWTGSTLTVSVSGFGAGGASSATASWTGTTVLVSVSGFTAVPGTVASWTGSTVTVGVSGFGVTNDGTADWSGSTVTVQVKGFAFRQVVPRKCLTSGARQALNHGLADLVGQLCTEFTVEGYGSFVGLCPEVIDRNQVGEGGFLPEADGVLTVQLSEFARVNLKPWVGMRLEIHGRVMIVTSRSYNEHRWALSLEQAMPMEPDLPTFDASIYHMG